jgi:uncharacterized membrane protein YfcA
VREHHRHGAVDWRIVSRMAPGMVLGALMSTSASGWIAQRTLALAFAAIVYAGAVQILLGRKPAAARQLPRLPGLVAVSLLIGVVCGLVSAGGAFLTVPFMLFCGVTMHTAIGTAAALGIPVALMGTIGFGVGGWGVADLPAASVGFVFIPALAALVVASSITAPAGARLAHRTPILTLRRVFAGLLMLLATKMALTYW